MQYAPTRCGHPPQVWDAARSPVIIEGFGVHYIVTRANYFTICTKLHEVCSASSPPQPLHCRHSPTPMPAFTCQVLHEGTRHDSRIFGDSLAPWMQEAEAATHKSDDDKPADAPPPGGYSYGQLLGMYTPRAEEEDDDDGAGSPYTSPYASPTAARLKSGSRRKRATSSKRRSRHLERMLRVLPTFAHDLASLD